LIIEGCKECTRVQIHFPDKSILFGKQIAVIGKELLEKI